MAVAIPFIGAAVGGAIGGTFLGVSAATIGYFAGSLLASALFKPPNQQGPRLGDRRIVGTEYGQAIPWLAGSPRLAGQYIWVSKLREIANTQKVGKGGSQKVTTYTYECDVMIMLSENVTEGVARDWLNAELIRNNSRVKSSFADAVTVYTGAPDQMPDPTYEAAVGAENALAYRGRTTIVIRGLQLGGGKQLPNLEHQAVKEGQLIVVQDFQDYSQNRFVVTRDTLNPAAGFQACTTDQFKFGQSGYFINGGPTGREPGLIVGNSTDVVDIGAGDWFVGCWCWLEDRNVSPRGTIFANQVNTVPINGIWLQVLNSGSNLRCNVRNDGSAGPTNQYILESATGCPVEQWFHAAVERSGTTLTLYRDGVIVDQITGIPSDYRLDPNQLWSIGGSPTGSADNFGGYLDDFEFSTVARYGGLAFTPPTSPHVPDQHTQIYVPFNSPTQLIPGTEPLGSVIQQMLLRAGYFGGEIDVDAALDTTEVYGYVTGEVTGTRAHLETLRPFGKYESCCVDKLYVFPRSTTPVGTIAWEDLGASESPDATEPFPLQLGNETELPGQIALKYRNWSADQNVGTEFSDRIISTQLSTQAVEMPFVMTPTQAKSTVEAMLLDLLAGLGKVTISTGGRKYAYVKPGDIVEVTNPAGRTFRLRVLSKRDSIVMIEFQCTLDDASALNPPAITYDGYISTEDPARVPPALWETLPIPALADGDATQPGPYIAISPDRVDDNDDYPGAVFVRAKFPEAYEQEFITADECVIGATLTELPAFDKGSTAVQFDAKVRVRVRGELSSSTWADIFVDRTINAAVIGNEPVRFIRADFVQADGAFNIYDISQILRGQLGQEHEIVEHPINTRFVLLNSSLRRMVNETTDIGQTHQLKAVTLNTLLSSVDGEDFTEDSVALKPYSPWSLRALPDVSDLAVTWRRRSRLVARYTDAGTFTPLGESAEAYRVKVYDGATLVRTSDVTSADWTYPAADITSDGFASGDPITITVQQLSDLVGEGFTATVETSAP